MMTLYWSPASPYARKVRTVVHEKGLAPLIADIVLDPFQNAEELISANPLGKVPTLILDDGSSLYDSPVICAYLDAHGRGQGPALIPSGPERWTVRRAEALGDGALDLAFGLVLERRKPDGERSPTTAARWWSQLPRALDAMERELPRLPGPCTLGHITFAVALGYLDFRHPDYQWRNGRASLAGWYDGFARRPSLAATAPK